MKNLIYLDYCATTPIHPAVNEAMLKTLDAAFGNPSSMHQAGITAMKLLNEARSSVAAGIGSDPDEIYFTSGATEADNLALFGIMHQFPPEGGHLITSSIEHHAILHPAQQLENEGYDVTFLPANSSGTIDPQDVVRAIKPNTRLISIMMVNNEVGSIQKIKEIGTIAAEHDIVFHTDAVQGIGLLDVDLNASNVDLLSLSAHKIYGPKGVGALYIKQGVTIKPLWYGGPQEKEIRPGTENIPGIVGLGEAIKVTARYKTQERERLTELKSWFINELKDAIPEVIINGDQNTSPHILSVSFPDAIAEMMLVRLNSEGIAVSLGSACTSKDIAPSHVLLAMGIPFTQIEGTIRISLGSQTNREQLSFVLSLLPEIWRKSRIK